MIDMAAKGDVEHSISESAREAAEGGYFRRTTYSMLTV
jgi:hypothetical protein